MVDPLHGRGRRRRHLAARIVGGPRARPGGCRHDRIRRRPPQGRAAVGRAGVRLGGGRASLGPSFALIIMGGGLASWIASRRWPGNEDGRLEATLAGIAGNFGGAFTAPVLVSVVVSEHAPTTKPRYTEAILPQLIAAMVAFVVFFQLAGPPSSTTSRSRSRTSPPGNSSSVWPSAAPRA